MKNTDNNNKSPKRGRIAVNEWQRRARYLLRHLYDPLALEDSPICKITELERLAREKYPRSVVSRGRALHDLILECLEEIEYELNGHERISRLKEFVCLTRGGKSVTEASRSLGVTPEHTIRSYKRKLVTFLAEKLQIKLHTPES